MERLRLSPAATAVSASPERSGVNEGAYVFITGRRKSELDAAVKEMGKNVTAVQGDVANLDDLDRLFAQIKKQKGKLDILFANAGIAKYAPLGTSTEELFDGGIAQV